MWTRLVTLACLAAGLLAAPERPEAGLSCPRSQGLFSHPTDCHLFLHCDHDHPYVKECPANLHFNAKLMVCDWPENAGCTGGAPTDPPPPDTDPEPGMECDCECCLEPNADDCTTYYICKEGKAYKATCAPGLVFNPEIQNCDLAGNYICEEPTTTTRKPATTTTTTQAPKPDFQCPTGDGLFPNPADCHSFYHCSNGHAYLKDCPSDLEFNPVLLVCDWPQSAGCSVKPTPAPKPKPTSPSGFDCPTSNGLFPNPTDCHSFYQCSNGDEYLMDCPANLEFNPKLLVCDWPENAGCSIKPTPAPKPKPTSPSGFDCPSDNGLFPNPADCHSFYQCSNGHAYLMDCPANLEFNPVLLVCDWPENAGCGGKPAPSPVPTTPKPTPKPDGICPNETCACRVPDPKDCNKYYQCKDGKAYPESCPAGLVFNPETEMCDYPEDVPGCQNPTTLKPTTKPTTRPTPKPTTRPTTPKPTTKPTAKPTTRPTTKPTTKPTPKPTTRPTPKPTTKPTPKPTTKPTPKPTPKPKPPKPDSSSSEESDSSESGSKSKHSGSKSKHSGSKSKHSGSKSKHSGSKSKHSGSKSKHSGSKSKRHDSKSKHSGSKSKHHKHSSELMQSSAPANSRLYRNPDQGRIEDDDGFLEAQFCPRPTGKFPSSRCHYYYHCVDGVPTLKRCLHGTRFYAPDQRCILGSC